ncbi:hypothetical protein A9Q78_07475 [Methylophaga sp. 41_12_T18]|nr:hypothetical protein A9Q78_07475 [Methylophaga sp. 41_12_T18]
MTAQLAKPRHSLIMVTLIVLSYSSSAVWASSPEQLQPCSEQWYELVEENIATGDGQGHGPDVGSSEWRSVVEFKLGIRGEPQLPAVYSEQWCEFIHRHYIDIGSQ